MGLNPKLIRYAIGYAPIPPVGTDFEVAMARTNDAILYGGTVYCTVDYDDEAALQNIVNQTPSMASKDYGKPFLQIFREADKDFYKIDHGLFAPAVIMINNAKTGRVFKAGQINPKVLSPILRILNSFHFLVTIAFLFLIVTAIVIIIAMGDCIGCDVCR